MVDKVGDPPKRFVTEHERTMLPAYALKVGMYVESLDRPWEETPFLFQGFIVETVEQLNTINDLCGYVFVNVTRSIEIRPTKTAPVTAKTQPSITIESVTTTQPATAPKVKPKAKRKRIPYPTPSTPADAEYPVALGHYEYGIALTKDFMAGIPEGKPINIHQVTASVSDCINSILRNPDAMLWLSKIREEDFYTSEHCFNVCVLALIFGRHLGFQGDDLTQLGICGMLHDVGKMSIPPDILNKPGVLNKLEFQVMRTHTDHGRDTLAIQENMLADAIEVAYSHHEMYDGTGYPRGLSGDSISEFSRIITICDVYDAITSDRVYKKAQSSHDALRVLYENRESKFDSELVVQFIQCIGLYPPGSIVELNSGEIAIVLATNFKKRRFPKIMIVLDKDKKLCQETIIDLSAVSKDDQVNTQLVKSTITNGSYGIRLEEYVKRGLKVG